MKQYLPSTTFIGVAAPLLVGFFVTVWLLFVGFQESTVRASTEELLALSTEAIVDEYFTTLDTDGDGLEDWEEHMWESDPQNRDTDGDGMNDNDEVEVEVVLIEPSERIQPFSLHTSRNELADSSV